VLEVTFNVPDRIPETVGEKLTLMEQLPFGARLLVQLVVWPKSPITEMAMFVTVVVALFVSVAVCALLVEFTAWLPNWNVAGVRVSVAPASCDLASSGATSSKQ
jgi:hypothetical protein